VAKHGNKSVTLTNEDINYIQKVQQVLGEEEGYRKKFKEF